MLKRTDFYELSSYYEGSHAERLHLWDKDYSV